MQLERDLELARQHGRWLSEEELGQLEQQRIQRQKLTGLLVVCLLIPPLWPLALALTLHLLFPATTRRLALGLGVTALVLGLLAMLVLGVLMVALLSLLF